LTWTLGGLALPFLLWPVPVATAADLRPDAATPASAPSVHHVEIFSLADAVRLALDQQPALAAHRASLAAAEAARRAVDNLFVPSILPSGRELVVRRQQAARGVVIATASLAQAEHETVYAVRRTYFSVLYAREQQAIAAKVVSELKDTLANAKLLLQGGSRDVTANDVDRITIYLRLAEGRQQEAERGLHQAGAALREALGISPSMCLRVAEARLPNPQPDLCLDQIIQLALARRGELVQAVNVAAVTALEVNAQETSRRPTARTFAAVADIHARPIPTGISDGEYRPGAVGVEMPTTLAGSRADRMDRARAFSARAGAVIDKTRNLIALEAEDAFLKWREAAQKVALTQEAAEKATKLGENLLKDFKGGQRVFPKDVIEAVVLAAQVRAQRNEALYQQILALAALERVTAGGFSACLEEATAGPGEPVPQVPNGNKPSGG
jgi:outer membrane protein TolC